MQNNRLTMMLSRVSATCLGGVGRTPQKYPVRARGGRRDGEAKKITSPFPVLSTPQQIEPGEDRLATPTLVSNLRVPSSDMQGRGTTDHGAAQFPVTHGLERERSSQGAGNGPNSRRYR